jgi:hypothetical protein
LTINAVQPERHTVTVSASPNNGGSTSGGGTYNHNTTAILRATPTSSNWTFDGWYCK